MKIKLQLNGENADVETDSEMFDAEYEIEMELDEKNLKKLENLLDRMVDDTGNTFFNWHYKLIA
jgi:hypothetical protein